MAIDPIDRPKLRAGVTVANVTLDGEPALVVADRDAGRYVRLGADAAAFLELMDGTRTIEEIARDAGQAAGVPVPVEPVRSFVKSFGSRGFLEGAPIGASPRRIDPLAFRLKLLDPDAIVGALRWLGTIAFSVPGIVAAVALGIAGALLLATRGLAAPVPAIGDPWTLVAFYVAASIALTLHELGHALALKSRGGVTREAGILLLYGMPCLYVNVTDAWLLPRRDRLLVSSAGLIVEVALFGAAAILMSFVPLHGVASVACFAVLAVCGARSILLNLNPLIRLDGYYILSDALGIPNLRPRAFRLIAGAIRKLFGASAADDVPARAGARIFLAAYGALALAYSSILVASILWFSARWLTSKLGPIGWAPWALLAAVILARPIARAVRALARTSAGA